MTPDRSARHEKLSGLLAALDDAGSRLETERRADEWMTSQHIVNPPRFTRAFASGFGDEP